VRAARRQDKITFLGLGNCRIGPIGAKEIADYIQFTAVLTKLNLEYNCMRYARGKQAVRDALRRTGVDLRVVVRLYAGCVCETVCVTLVKAAARCV
jgi:hypothetical protein